MAIKKKTVFMSDHRAEKEEEKRQQHLRQRHMVEDSSVRIIEKNHGILLAIKFLWEKAEGFVRLLFSAAIFVLASVGVVSLMLEVTRNSLLAYFTELYHLFF